MKPTSPQSPAKPRVSPWICSTRHGVLAVALLLAAARPLTAQVTGTAAVAQAPELGLDRDHKARDFTVREIEGSAPANVLWPGDRPSLRFLVTNETSAPLAEEEGVFRTLYYALHGRPGDIWTPQFVPMEDAGSIPFKVDLAPHASTEVAVEPGISEIYGGYVHVAELTGHGNAFAASLVRSILPDHGVVQFPAYALDLNKTSEEGVKLFQRLGVKGACLGLPAFGGAPTGHDNVQIAFNVLPPDRKPWLPNPPGVPPRWMVYWDSDYEYALNEVAAAHGGGTEIWRLQTPGMPRKHFYPRQPASSFDGPVRDGKLVCRREGDTRIVEAAIPWSEIPEVRKCLDTGRNIKFDFRVNDNAGPSYELAEDRSVSKINFAAFHDDWQTHWANELEFGFEK